MKISVVAPLFRSAAYIEPLYRRCVDSIRSMGADYEIVLVNDASPDDSLTIAKNIAAKDEKVAVVDLARNYGQHRAIMVGLEHSGGDLVFVLDSDLEDEPEWVVRFYDEMQRTSCDVVYGVQARKRRGPAYRCARGFFFGIMKLLSGTAFRENAINARLMTRRYVDAVLRFKEREMFIDGIFEMCGFAQVPVSVVKHDDSPTSYTLPRLLSLALNGITSFSTRPLIAISFVGVSVCIFAFSYTALIVLQKLFFDVPLEGWPSIMAAILVIGGISLLCNGIIAIYLAKVFLEVKQRPLSIVREVYQHPRHDAEHHINSEAKAGETGSTSSRDLSARKRREESALPPFDA